MEHSTTPEPRTRVRINLSRTIREGWSHDTTIEIEWPGLDRDTAMLTRAEQLQREADRIGRHEASLRNLAEGRP